MRNLRNAIDKMLTEAETAAKAIEISKQLDSLPPGHALLRQLEELEGTWNGFDQADYDRLNREMVRVSFLRRMQLVGFNNYVNLQPRRACAGPLHSGSRHDTGTSDGTPEHEGREQFGKLYKRYAC